MGLYASADDIADRYESQLSDEQLTWVGVRVLDAEALLFTHIPRLADISLTSSSDQANAKRVVADAVLRVLRNPAGIQQESTGPWSVTRNRDTASGALFFTPEELATFRITRRKRVGMVGIAPPRWVT